MTEGRSVSDGSSAVVAGGALGVLSELIPVSSSSLSRLAALDKVALSSSSASNSSALSSVTTVEAK
jgi:hypothetical protein